MRRDPDITVAGGGPIAAATALAAAARGMTVCQLLPATVPAAGRRHYALSRRSVRFLSALGVAAERRPVMRFALRAGGRTLTLGDGKTPLCEMTTEQQLHAALDSRLSQASITRLSSDNITCDGMHDDHVQLNVDGKPHRTALLAVADGARSPLAAQLGIHGSVTDFHQHAVVADIRAPQLDNDTATQWFGDNDIVALLPAGGGVFSLVWSTATPPPPAGVAAALRQRTGIEKLTVRRGSVQTFPLRAATRATRVTQRAALLGDAAGVVHPLAGQGLNLGLADAETLIRCTHRRARGNIAAGLAAYAAARQPRHQKLQHITQFLLPSERRVAALLSVARLPLLGNLAICFAND